MSRFRPFLVFAIFVLAGASPALADPPGRVGRISFIEGQASLFRPGQENWAAVDVNYPVVAGDSLWSPQGSRIEVQIGAAEIHLDEMSEASLVRLDESGATLRIDQGVASLHLSALPPGGIQVQTTAGQVELLRPGTYHIDAGRQDGLVQIGVIEGEARLSGPRGDVDIRPGEAAQAGAGMSSFAMTPVAFTQFDSWVMARVRNEQIAQTAPYVSTEMTGYQDLATNGQWASSPDYGPLWIPTTVAPDWAPYRFGHWAYVEPWGWTWIDDAPWGFAPFHYGRWIEWRGRWAWCPGRVVEHPVYAPALVAFIGAPGIGIDITAGAHSGPGVAWIPLGPNEPFHPYYRVSDTYVRNINHVTNVTTINTTTVNTYVNQRAVTAVPNAAFTGAQPINRAALQVLPGQINQQPTTTDLGHLRPDATVRPSGGPRPTGWTGPRPAAQPATPAAMPAQAPQNRPQQQQPQQQQQPIQPQRPTAPAPQQTQPQAQPSGMPHQAIPQAQAPQPQAQPRPQPQPQAQPAPQHPQVPAAQPQQPHPQQQQPQHQNEHERGDHEQGGENH